MIFDRNYLSGGGSVPTGVHGCPGHDRVTLRELRRSVIGDCQQSAVVIGRERGTQGYARRVAFAGISRHIGQDRWSSDCRRLMILNRHYLGGGGSIAAAVHGSPGHGGITLRELGRGIVGHSGYTAVVVSS